MTPLHTQTTGKEDLMNTDIFCGIFLVAIALVLIGLTMGKICPLERREKIGGKKTSRSGRKFKK